MDRFIPTRSAMDFDSANFSLSKENKQGEQGSPSKEESYQKALAASLSVHDSSRILAFKQKAPAAPEGYENSLKSLYNQNLAPTVKKTFRHVPTTQERILDAPELMDDYYLNLLDWSGQNLVGCYAHAQGGREPVVKGRKGNGVCTCRHGRQGCSLPGP